MLYDILVFVDTVLSASIPGGMAELVDAADLKSVSRKRVRVQVSLSPYSLLSNTVLTDLFGCRFQIK